MYLSESERDFELPLPSPAHDLSSLHLCGAWCMALLHYCKSLSSSSRLHPISVGKNFLLCLTDLYVIDDIWELFNKSKCLSLCIQQLYIGCLGRSSSLGVRTVKMNFSGVGWRASVALLDLLWCCRTVGHKCGGNLKEAIQSSFSSADCSCAHPGKHSWTTHNLPDSIFKSYCSWISVWLRSFLGIISLFQVSIDWFNFW